MFEIKQNCFLNFAGGKHVVWNHVEGTQTAGAHLGNDSVFVASAAARQA